MKSEVIFRYGMNKLLVMFVCWHYWGMTGAANSAIIIMVIDFLLIVFQSGREQAIDKNGIDKNQETIDRIEKAKAEKESLHHVKYKDKSSRE